MDMAMSTFSIADLYAYHPTKQLYPEYNSRMSFFEEEVTDVGDQDNEEVDTTTDTYQSTSPNIS